MPYRVTVEKHYAAFQAYWTNIYWITAADLAAGLTQAQAIVNAEKPLYANHITITKARVDDGVPETEQFSTLVPNAVGTRATPAGDDFPLFLTARVDFQVADNGRPCRKYLRGVLFESDSGIAVLGAGIKTILQTYATAIAATTACDPQGFDIVSGAPFGAPQMRQLRRGSKRPATP